MDTEMNIPFWKRIYTDFEEASPLTFGHNDHPLEAGNWKISVSSGITFQSLVAAWVLLLSRYSGGSKITIGYQNINDSTFQPLRLTLSKTLSTSLFVQSITDQVEEQLNVFPIDQSNLRRILGLPDHKVFFTSSVHQIITGEFELRGTGGYSDETLAMVSSHLQRILSKLEQAEDVRVRNVDPLTYEELNTLTRKWNPDPTPYPQESVHVLFEKQVVARKQAIALIYKDQKLSYIDLNIKANRLAHLLIENGVKPGEHVAVFLERSVDFIVSILAILKAGGSYIPLDIEFPVERIEQMLEDAESKRLISHSILQDRLKDQTAVKVLLVDEMHEELTSYPNHNPGVSNDPDMPAYIIFTSGTTGRPKGCEVIHRGIVRLLFGVDYVPLNTDTVILQMVSVSFDVSTFEIWGGLLQGGTCVLCPSRVMTHEALGRLLMEHQVNTLWMTTSIFNLVVKESSHILTGVKYLLTGGEALSAKYVAKALKDLPEVELINGYGPTENTVFSTAYTFDHSTFDANGPVTIGRPIGNSSCYILDDLHRPVPIGVSGELYLGGDGVARGYVNKPDLTAERFLDDPFSEIPNARMYKTGDKVYWNPDGTIGFIGRVDQQIKLRGNRIELPDIDLALGTFAGVEQAVSVVYEDDIHGKWLAAFVKVDDPEIFSTEELNLYAHEKLPSYMIPSIFVPVAKWRYTPSGKLDKKALPRPEFKAPQCGEGNAVYESDTESVLAEIWTELLGMNRISRDCDFFELGGDSLRAVTLFLRIQQRFNKDFPLAIINQASTIATLGKLIDGQNNSDSLSSYRSVQILQQGHSGKTPLILIHGGAGNVLIFTEFIHNLGPEHPVYAFQWSGWDGSEGHHSQEEMADFYMEEILAVCPAQKYRIGGHCIGGLVAIELAAKLTARGIAIEGPIIVSDSPNLYSTTHHKFGPAILPSSYKAYQKMVDGLHARELEGRDVNCNANTPGLVEWIKSIPMVISLARLIRDLPDLLRIYGSLRKGKTVPVELRSLYSSRTLVQAAKNHKPSSYIGDILYFRSYCALGRNMGLYGWWDDDFMGFAELCEGRFEGHVVGGGHNEPLKNPISASIVKECYKRLDAEKDND